MRCTWAAWRCTGSKRVRERRPLIQLTATAAWPSASSGCLSPTDTGDVVGLYLNPPVNAVVFSFDDERGKKVFDAYAPLWM